MNIQNHVESPVPNQIETDSIAILLLMRSLSNGSQHLIFHFCHPGFHLRRPKHQWNRFCCFVLIAKFSAFFPVVWTGLTCDAICSENDTSGIIQAWYCSFSPCMFFPKHNTYGITYRNSNMLTLAEIWSASWALWKFESHKTDWFRSLINLNDLQSL